MKTYQRHLRNTRKHLRNNTTFYEGLLWEEIKGNKLGVRFRRQVSIDNYVVDFACLTLKIVIEIDGQNHFTAIGKVNDGNRDECLQQNGFIILRFENIEIKNQRELVVEKIKEVIKAINS